MYLTAILVSLMICGIIEVYNNKKNLILTFSFVALFFLLSALRWERGTDWLSYYDLYHTPYMLGDNAYEITYLGLNLFFGQILRLDYSLFLAIQAFVIYFLSWIALKRDCCYPLFALLCLYATLGNGGIFFVRQTISIAIIFFSFHYVMERKLKAFILCSLLAMCFHRASLIALLIYFIFNYTLSTRIIKYIIVFGFLLILLGYLGFLTTALEKFAGYQDVGNENISATQFLLGTLNKFFYLFVFLLFKPTFSKLSDSSIKQKVNGYLRIYLYGMFLYIFFGSINITLSRLSNFVNILVVYQICEWLRLSANYRRRRLLALVFVLMFAGRALFSVSEYQNLFVPYKSIFNKNLPVNVE